MAINYAWDVSTVDVYPSKSSKSNVVHSVHWRLKATDDTNTISVDGVDVNITAECYGLQELDTSDLSSFKNFSTLTATDVQTWVENALGSTEVANKKTKLDAEIAEQVTPTSVTKTIG
tara:strand:- start:390 stop:743 length:354 start_codon:yes stop_codon:yes gene_type:complete